MIFFRTIVSVNPILIPWNKSLFIANISSCNPVIKHYNIFAYTILARKYMAMNSWYPIFPYSTCSFFSSSVSAFSRPRILNATFPSSSFRLSNHSRYYFVPGNKNRCLCQYPPDTHYDVTCGLYPDANTYKSRCGYHYYDTPNRLLKLLAKRKFAGHLLGTIY